MFFEMDDDELYKYDIEYEEEQGALEYEIGINEQFDKTDIRALAIELNDIISENLNSGVNINNFKFTIEGYNNYLEITAVNDQSDWEASVQLSYYKLCFYANRLSVATLSEKITDFIVDAEEGYLTGDDAQALFDKYI